jgi:hypothetical protein
VTVYDCGGRGKTDRQRDEGGTEREDDWGLAAGRVCGRIKAKKSYGGNG